MNAAPPIVVPILATPFGVVPLPEAEALNPLLAALFAARLRSDTLQPQTNPLCHIGRDDLLEWAEEPVQRLTAAMVRGVYSVVQAVNEFTEAQVRSLTLQARAWFTIIEPDGCVPAANHPLTAWCGVYCVAAPPASATRKDSGLLRLHESRLGTMFADATNASMQLPYKPGHYGWRPVPGQMAVFPGSLSHEIALIRAAERMVLVTIRARFLGPGQQGVARW